MRLRLLPAVVLLAAFLLVPAPGVPAESPTDDATAAEQPDRPSRAAIEARIADVEAAASMNAELRSKIAAVYRDVLQALEASEASLSKAEAFKEAVESAPKEARALRADLGKSVPGPVSAESIGVSRAAPLPDLEGRLAKEEGELSALESQLADLEKRLKTQQARPAEARKRLAELAPERDAAEQALAAPAPADEAPELTRARRVLQQVKLDALQAETRMLEQELLSHAGRLDLLRAKRDSIGRLLDEASQRVGLLRDIVNERRRAETERAKAQAVAAERDAAGKGPVVRQLAASNAELARDAARLTEGLEQLAQRREQTEKRSRQLQQDLESTRQKLEIGGLSETLGRILVEDRRKLPTLRETRKEMAELRDRLSETALAEVRLEEERRDLADLADRADKLISEGAPAGLSQDERARLREELLVLLEDRRQLVEKAAADYGAYVRALAELDAAKQRFSDTVSAYGDLLDEHLLWIPSAQPMGMETLRHLMDAPPWLLDPGHWREAGKDLFRAVRRSPAGFVGGLILFGVLVAARRRLREAIDQISKRVGKVQTDRYVLTIWALGATLLLALPWPFLVWLIGSLLEGLADASAFTQALGRALRVIAPALFGTSVFLWLTVQRGVGDAHFRWQPATLALLRRSIPELALWAIPAGFVVVLAANSGDADLRYSLARVAFVVIMGALAWFLARLLSPEKGVTQSYVAKRPEGWLARTRRLWYPAAVAFPLVLVGLAVMGYFYAAGQLAGQLVDTLWLVLAAVVGHDLSVRWLALTRRRLAYKLARERREASRTAAQDTAGVSAEIPPPPPEETVDLEAIDTQTRRLVHALIGWSLVVGLYLIWQDVLPALGMLDQVSLWNQTVTVGGEDRIEPITLAAVILAAVVGIVTAVAARNLPGVLEIAFLQRLNIEPGTRYAAATLSRYFIVAVGTVLVFQNLGASWSSIQWLVAALGVGLGFGLQEIFGNFVSGMIILFERPIRVGDTVTVADLSGTVSRIRIRATTITDWDRKEIVVPNKSFITERVVNWTLSDPITRQVIPVGVAYGSDTALAHRVMLETIRGLPLVLDEPEPRVFFDGFGESSLDFKLYVYARQLADRLPLKHEVHMAVNRALTENGIQIPFPQRDIHVRSTPASRGRGRKPDGAGD